MENEAINQEVEAKEISEEFNNTTNMKAPLIAIMSISVLALFIVGFIEVKNRKIPSEKIPFESSQSTQPINTSVIKEQKPFVIKDLPDRFTFTFPYGSFGEFHGTIEVSPMGRHGHDYDPKYRLVEEALIIAGTMNQPQNITLLSPFSIVAKYDPDYSTHVDKSKLLFLFTPDSPGYSRYLWEELVTEIDTSLNIARTTGTKLGNYVLVGPLICPEDTNEFDDNYDASKLIERDKYGIEIPMIFDIPRDQNWIRFLAKRGKTYKIETVNLVSGVKPIIEIYDNSGVNLLVAKPNNIVWNPPQDLFNQSPEVNYFVNIKPEETSAIGCEATFSLKITEL